MIDEFSTATGSSIRWRVAQRGARYILTQLVFMERSSFHNVSSRCFEVRGEAFNLAKLSAFKLIVKPNDERFKGTRTRRIPIRLEG